MRRAAASVFVCFAVLSAVTLAGPGAKAADSADECVRLEESAREGGLSLSVENHCERGLACAVAWTVQCETATGKITRRSRDGARFVVHASGSHAAFASAKSCGDSWRIDEVSWDCAPVK